MAMFKKGEALSPADQAVAELVVKHAKVQAAYDAAAVATREPTNLIMAVSAEIAEMAERNQDHADNGEPLEDSTHLHVELARAQQASVIFEAALARRVADVVRSGNELKRAAKHSHDLKYAKLIQDFLDAIQTVIAERYDPMVRCYLEDPRNLPNFVIPFFTPDAMAHMRGQADGFSDSLQPRVAKPLAANLTLLEFPQSFAGGTIYEGGISRGIVPAYRAGERAAFNETTTKWLLSKGAAIRVTLEGVAA